MLDSIETSAAETFTIPVETAEILRSATMVILLSRAHIELRRIS